MADSLSFLDDQDSEPEEAGIELGISSSECANKSVNRLDDSDYGSNPASFILQSYSKRCEDKGRISPGIRQISHSILKNFAPQSSPDVIDKAVDLACWRSLGFGNTGEEENEKPSPSNPLELFTSAEDLLKKVEYIDLACPLFNQILGGGLRCGAITELSGESSSGKSQICLHTAAISALRGKPVIYLQTEGSFPMSRLRQILCTRLENSDDVVRAMNNVLIMKIHSFSHMQLVLDKDLVRTVKERGVRLVILDSITALIRGDKDIENISERTSIIKRIGVKIQELCKDQGVAVLVVNQVSAAINFPGHTYGRDVVPSLGSLWTNAINTRLFLTKTSFIVNKGMVAGMQTDSSLRTLEVDFSSYLPEDFFNFVVTSDGITGVEITD